MKKKTSKKPTNNVNVQVRYGISVPEPDMFNLIKNDAAGILSDFFEKYLKWIPNDIYRISASLITVLRDAQAQWSAALAPYIKSGKSPAKEDWVRKQMVKQHDGTKVKGAKAKKDKAAKPKLSNAEVKKVVSLRAKGLSIKAIGKTIHRAEKVVADIVRTLPHAPRPREK